MTLALAVALVALLLSGLTAYGLWSALRHRRAILQSEAQYRQCAQTYSPGSHVR
jgi:CHASE1-domain containing sensor protein